MSWSFRTRILDSFNLVAQSFYISGYLHVIVWDSPLSWRKCNFKQIRWHHTWFLDSELPSVGSLLLHEMMFLEIDLHFETRSDIFLAFTTLEVQDIHSFWILSICHAPHGMHMHFSFANQAQTALHMHAFLRICPAYIEAWLAEAIHLS